MTAAPTILVNANGHDELAADIARRLRIVGLPSSPIDPSRPLAEQRGRVARGDILVSLYPEDRDALAWLRLAAGLGATNVVLGADGSGFPAGTKVFPAAQELILRIANEAQGVEREGAITAQTFEHLDGCPEGVDWFTRTYPTGIRREDWTLARQLEALKAGGGRWAKMAVEHGVFRQWPMNGVDLRGSDLTRAHLVDAKLAQADLEGAILTRSQWTGADFARANLAGTVMDGVVLRGCDMSGARLRASRLHDAHIIETKLDGADLAQAELSRAHVRATSLKGATLAGADLSATSVEAANFSTADLTGANLGSTQFFRCRFDGARFASARLRGTVFRDCDLAGADLDPASSEIHVRGGRQ